jgi:hypothetical protein
VYSMDFVASDVSVVSGTYGVSGAPVPGSSRPPCAVPLGASWTCEELAECDCRSGDGWVFRGDATGVESSVARPWSVTSTVAGECGTVTVSV